MAGLIEIIKSFDDFAAMHGAEEQAINDAEEKLGLKFSSEYRTYLKEFGAACANGHELTGIGVPARLDVVEVTSKAKMKNKSIPSNLYVIEDVGIDKILTWQDNFGKLYQTVGANDPEPIKKTLIEYIQA